MAIRLVSSFGVVARRVYVARKMNVSDFAKSTERRTRKLSDLEVRGFEPLAFSLRTRRSTN